MSFGNPLHLTFFRTLPLLLRNTYFVCSAHIHTEEAASQHYERVDAPNFELVAATAAQADVIVRITADRNVRRVVSATIAPAIAQ